jgi:hypothetical protein
MRRAVTAAVVLLSLAMVAEAGATTNPVRLYGAPMSCPDPDVFNYGRQYVAACTSDFGQDNPEPRKHRMGPVPAAFPIYVSTDLQHWRFVNYIFPPGHSVAGAPAPKGQWPGGEFWAPEIHKIGSRWVAYFGARLSTKAPQMGLFVAWTRHLFGGNWQSKLLYRHHGVIDPSVARVGGQLMIVYCQQPAQIWGGELSADGLTMLPDEQLIARPTLPWEAGRHGSGVEEGPVLWRHDGQTFIMYNAASTWNNSYKVGLLEQTTGARLVSVGIGAQPFRTPKGLEVAVHVQFNPARHRMERRYLSFLPLVLRSVAAESPGASDGLPEVPGGVAHAVRPAGT